MPGNADDVPGVETDEEYELVTSSRNTALRCYASLGALRLERGELGGQCLYSFGAERHEISDTAGADVTRNKLIFS